MRQIVLAVDDNGKFLEYIPKEVGHSGLGRKHLAIAVLLINSKDQVLLQKRKHQIFNNIWDLTGATHPLHFRNGIDESLEEATYRCLKEEWGITEKISLKNLSFFDYFAKYGNYCENEHCFMMVGKYDGQINLNPEMGYEYRWAERKKFLKDIASNPQKYTPWAAQGIKILQSAGFSD